jgi:hypothetical protein
MNTTKKQELQNVINSINKNLEATGKHIKIEGRNDYICFDLHTAQSCECMLASFQRYKEALNCAYAIQQITRLFNNK